MFSHQIVGQYNMSDVTIKNVFDEPKCTKNEWNGEKD